MRILLVRMEEGGVADWWWELQSKEEEEDLQSAVSVARQGLSREVTPSGVDLPLLVLPEPWDGAKEVVWSVGSPALSMVPIFSLFFLVWLCDCVVLCCCVFPFCSVLHSSFQALLRLTLLFDHIPWSHLLLWIRRRRRRKKKRTNNKSNTSVILFFFFVLIFEGKKSVWMQQIVSDSEGKNNKEIQMQLKQQEELSVEVTTANSDSAAANPSASQHDEVKAKGAQQQQENTGLTTSTASTTSPTMTIDPGRVSPPAGAKMETKAPAPADALAQQALLSKVLLFLPPTETCERLWSASPVILCVRSITEAAVRAAAWMPWPSWDYKCHLLATGSAKLGRSARPI